MNGTESGARAILRVTEVLKAIAARPAGVSLTELGQIVDMPKSSLHRLLKTLLRGHYLSSGPSGYGLGPKSFDLGRHIISAQPTSRFPACTRPVLTRLADETRESVVLAVPSDAGTVSYIDVIDSIRPLRVTVPVGSRPWLYQAAAGKAVLAFLPAEERARYLDETVFEQVTPWTTTREDLPALLDAIRARAIVHDRNSSVEGASSVASPVFAAEGGIFAAIAVVGPTERIDDQRQEIENLVVASGERISRMLGFRGDYPVDDRLRHQRRTGFA